MNMARHSSSFDDAKNSKKKVVPVLPDLQQIFIKSTQYAKRILNKIVKQFNATFSGLKCTLWETILKSK